MFGRTPFFQNNCKYDRNNHDTMRYFSIESVNNYRDKWNIFLKTYIQKLFYTLVNRLFLFLSYKSFNWIHSLN